MKTILLSAALLACGQVQAKADEPRIVTLGTMAGPMANPLRGQPATLLQWPGGMLLVDAGDGVVDQLAKAGINPVPLKRIIITHIHADHVGGSIS